MLSDKNVENLKIRIDGPFGSSSDKILQCENLIIIAEDKGVAKFASVLQDIYHRTKKNQIHSKVKTLNFIWLCSEGNYFEWFKKMLQELDKNFDLDNFKYNIYFLDRSASDLPKDMLYVSKDVFKKEFKINLLPGVKSRYHTGTPSVQNKLSEIISEIDNGKFDLFFAGSRKIKSKIKSACKRLKSLESTFQTQHKKQEEIWVGENTKSNKLMKRLDSEINVIKTSKIEYQTLSNSLKPMVD